MYVQEKTLLEELRSHNNLEKNLPVSGLVERILLREEATLSAKGAVRATTGIYTGRSPKDKFIVRDEVSEDHIDWGTVNQPIDEVLFDNLYEKVVTYLKEKDELFHFKGFAGADKDYRLPIEVFNEYAWHNLFARQLFIKPNKEELQSHQPKFTIVSAPTYKAAPEIDGTNSKTFILVSFKKRIILIGGTEYAGEMKKSIFSVMNYLLPRQNILSMHCSATVGNDNRVALFFGLSGTGKTTLSADPNRRLIGDDEHGWTPNGVFNIEGGCYAKCINLSEEKEPQIHGAIQYGSVLENVILDEESGNPNYEDTSLTENTRAAYPLENIDDVVSPSISGHPDTIFFLTADASGILPPISKLTKEQAMYYYLSGYTSKLAGTERGVTEPQATFSSCFASPFLPLAPTTYAKMLGERIDDYNANVFLVNTGWTGGSYGTGKRIELSYTRAMVHAAIDGQLDSLETFHDDIFGLEIPIKVPGVPSEILIPKNTWTNKKAYDTQAKELARKFHENFEKFSHLNEDISKAGPLS
ncbi:phosphoenolpyruvate carboxykinase (ATP) [Virgibacillus natechei]